MVVVVVVVVVVVMIMMMMMIVTCVSVSIYSSASVCDKMRHEWQILCFRDWKPGVDVVCK
jgi:hypothetical protein